MNIEETIPHGLFGCAMTWILEVLPYLKAHALYPVWKIDTLWYGPLFPHVLIAKRELPGSKTVKLTSLTKEHKYTFTGSDFALAHDLFFEYFAIAPDIWATVMATDLTTKTLGVHYRGTDKFKNEASFISKTDVIRNIRAFLARGLYDTLFVASDEADFVTDIVQAFQQDKYKIICANAQRSTTGKPVHLQEAKNVKRAKEALIDSLLLSKCKTVIKTSSCLSDWVKIWNPEIEVYNLNTYKLAWFPQAFIPVKSFLD